MKQNSLRNVIYLGSYLESYRVFFGNFLLDRPDLHVWVQDCHNYDTVSVFPIHMSQNIQRLLTKPPSSHSLWRHNSSVHNSTVISLLKKQSFVNWNSRCIRIIFVYMCHLRKKAAMCRIDCLCLGLGNYCHVVQQMVEGLYMSFVSAAEMVLAPLPHMTLYRYPSYPMQTSHHELGMKHNDI